MQTEITNSTLLSSLVGQRALITFDEGTIINARILLDPNDGYILLVFKSNSKATLKDSQNFGWPLLISIPPLDYSTLNPEEDDYAWCFASDVTVGDILGNSLGIWFNVSDFTIIND